MYSLLYFYDMDVSTCTVYFDGLVRDYSNSSALAVEFLQYSTEPLILCDVPSSLLYKMHQIPTLKRSSYRLAAVFAESLEARC